MISGEPQHWWPLLTTADHCTHFSLAWASEGTVEPLPLLYISLVPIVYDLPAHKLGSFSTGHGQHRRSLLIGCLSHTWSVGWRTNTTLCTRPMALSIGRDSCVRPTNWLSFPTQSATAGLFDTFRWVYDWFVVFGERWLHSSLRVSMPVVMKAIDIWIVFTPIVRNEGLSDTRIGWWQHWCHKWLIRWPNAKPKAYFGSIFVLSVLSR